MRSGTSAPDVEPVPSRTALPNSPLRSGPSVAEHAGSAPPGANAARAGGFSERALVVARQRPVLWMVLTPLLVAACVILVGRHGHTQSSASTMSGGAPPAPPAAMAAEPSVSIAVLEAKPAESLTVPELLRLAGARSERQVAAASALRQKLEATPALGKDSAVQADLLRLASDERTARDALAGMAALEAPVGADLLYETWTGTARHSDTTELARALLYSGDVRRKASPALAVALELRTAETCQQYQAILPAALKDGDRRSLQLLGKLNGKRGCGPRKSSDCFACLREPKDELSAAISAAKSRHAPSYAAE